MSTEVVPHFFLIPGAQFWATTGAFLALMAVLCLCSLAVSKKNRSTMLVTSIGSVLCFWLMWFCTFAMQINPLIVPEISVRAAVADVDATGRNTV